MASKHKLYNPLLWDEDPRLDQLLVLLNGEKHWFNKAEEAFIRASQAQRLRKQKRRRREIRSAFAILGILLIAAVITSILAVQQSRVALKNAQAAQDSARVAQEQRQVAQFARKGAEDSARVAQEQRLIAQQQADTARLERDRARREAQRADDSARVAQEQRNIALENLNQAIANNLAIQGNYLLEQEENGQLALETVLPAYQKIPQNPRVQQVMYQALSPAYKRYRVFPYGKGPVNEMIPNPNGKNFLFFSSKPRAREGRAFLLDWKAQKQIWLEAHQGRITSADFSANGQYIVTSSTDGTAKLWQSSNGQLLRTFSLNAGELHRVLWHPSQQKILLASDKQLFLVNLSGEILAKTNIYRAPSHLDWLNPESVLVHSATASIWRIGEEKEQVLDPRETHSLVRKLSNGQIFTLNPYELRARFWSAEGQALREFSLAAHSQRVSLVRLLPNGKGFLTFGEDASLKLWDFSGELTLEIKQNLRKTVEELIISPDSRYAILKDQGLESFWALYDLQNGQEVFRQAVSQHVTLQFSSDGQFIVEAGGAQRHKLRIWDFQGNLQEQLPVSFNVMYIHLAQLSADRRHLFSSLEVNGEDALLLWDLSGYQLLNRRYDKMLQTMAQPQLQTCLVGTKSGVRRVYWQNKQPDDTLLQSEEGLDKVAFARNGAYFASSTYQSSEAKLYNAKGTLIARLEGHTAPISGLVFSPNGRYLLSIAGKAAQPQQGKDYAVRLWNIKGELIAKLPQGEAITSAYFSPSGRYIVSTGNYLKTTNSPAKIWDLQGNLLQTLSQNNYHVREVIFSPDERSLLAVSNFGVDLKNLKTGKLLQRFANQSQACFSPNGKFVLTARQSSQSGRTDALATLWTLQGQALATYKDQPPGYQNTFEEVSFSPNGQYILTRIYDKVKIWDLQGRLLTDISDKENTLKNLSPILSAAFTPDSRYVLLSSQLNRISLWDLEGNFLANLAEFQYYEGLDFSVSPDGQYLTAFCSQSGEVKVMLIRLEAILPRFDWLILNKS